jgi:hypothetical protein
MTLVLNHSDEVSGATHYDTGHIAYWSGNSAAVVAHPDGQITLESLADQQTPLATKMRDLEENQWSTDAPPVRKMMPLEEALCDTLMATHLTTGDTVHSCDGSWE